MPLLKHLLPNLSLAISLIWSSGLIAQKDSLRQVIETATSDSVKTDAYFKLYREYLYSEPEKARECIHEAFEMARSSDNLRSMVLCYDKWGGIEMVLGDFDAALKFYGQADSLLKEMDWPRQKAVIYGNFAGIYKDQGDYKKALEWNEKFLDIARQLENNMFIGFGWNVSGDIYNMKGQYNLAAKHHLEALRNYELSGDSARIADGSLKLGEAHMSAERFDDAQYYLKQASGMYQRMNDLFYLSESESSLGYLHFLREEYGEAEQYYKRVDSLATVLEADYVRLEALTGYLDIAYGREEYVTALALVDEALNLNNTVEDTYEEAWLYIKKARILVQLGSLDEANKVNSMAEQVVKEYEITSAFKAIHQNYFNIFKAQNDYAKALEELELYNFYQDSLDNVQTRTQIEELQLIYDVEKKEQKLALSEKENELLKSKAEVDGLKKQLLWWSMIGLVLLAGVAIFWQSRLARNRKKFEKERTLRQEAELHAQRRENEQLERELASQVLQLCQKNELLASVQSKLSGLVQSASDSNGNELRSLERNLELNLQNEESWSQFLVSFEKVHPQYLTKLRENVQSLSPAEQRLACLLKMNLSSKEMSTILNISAEGVKKARYRLRKKLQLDSKVNLSDYLLKV